MTHLKFKPLLTPLFETLFTFKVASLLKISDRKPGVGFPGAPGGPDPGAGVGPGDCTSQKPGAGGFLLSKPRGFRGVF